VRLKSEWEVLESLRRFRVPARGVITTRFDGMGEVELTGTGMREGKISEGPGVEVDGRDASF